MRGNADLCNSHFMKSLVFASVTALLGLSSLMADVVLYDNGGPDQTTGDEMTHLIQAEDFVLGIDAAIGRVNFWALDSNPSAYQGSIAWAIGADAGGSPGAALAFGTATATVTGTGNIVGIGAQSLVEDLVSFTIPKFSALSGSHYWLELHNGPTSTNADLGFYWETSSSAPVNDVNTGQEISLPGGDFWADNGNEHAFQLIQVPEPSGLLLLVTLIGLAGLAKLRYKRTARR
jgi:hypothetical protein